MPFTWTEVVDSIDNFPNMAVHPDKIHNEFWKQIKLFDI